LPKKRKGKKVTKAYTHARRVAAAKKGLRTKRKRYGKDLKKG
jgi:hypothetical protein